MKLNTPLVTITILRQQEHFVLGQKPDGGLVVGYRPNNDDNVCYYGYHTSDLEDATRVLKERANSSGKSNAGVDSN